MDDQDRSDRIVTDSGAQVVAMIADVEKARSAEPWRVALGAALDEAGASRPVATVLAQVVVAPDDPGFARPTKPIGPFYSQAEAEVRRSRGWVMVEAPPHGDRRVVASPEPLEIVEEPVIRTLVETGVLVVTLGGGGIPVVRNAHRLTGVEAVVDKGLSSALLAIASFSHRRGSALSRSRPVERAWSRPRHIR
jgi:carbamate kinase